MNKAISERALQTYVHAIISDPSKVFYTKNKKRLQILSPGSINPYEGPDFKELAFLLNGNLIIADAEYHRKSSEWFSHSHNNDKKYEKVILHICSEIDKEVPGIEHLQISYDEIDKIKVKSENKELDLASTEELQHFALLRLMRLVSQAQKEINIKGLDLAYKSVLSDFIQRFDKKRRRPTYSTQKLSDFLENSYDFPTYKFLKNLDSYNSKDISRTMTSLIKEKYYNEGDHLRREICMNCILPLSLCLAGVSSRIGLFHWFWSTPALFKYGVLARRFKDIPQDYIWQQQGMLEYIKEKGQSPASISEAVQRYGLAALIHFYKEYQNPMDFELNDIDFIEEFQEDMK